MKISAYYKSIGANVKLKLNYDNLGEYDKVTISKVFMDTEIPGEPQDQYSKDEDHVADFYRNNPILNLPNVEYGGTGFFYDKAPTLPDYVEHIKPDYHLYDEWVKTKIESGANPKDFQYYTDYSIGFTSRGCIRGCSFCVNKKYHKCELHSPVEEFLDKERRYICLLDDNIFACAQWKQVFDSLIRISKPFQFKQGLDERLLTDEKCEYLFKKVKWKGDRIFAFDNIRDKDIIVNKLKMIRRHTTYIPKFYVLCAFNHENPGHYDETFWKQDIKDMFERIRILMSYGCLPFVMKYRDFQLSPYSRFYTTVARWCNQPSFLKKTTLWEFAEINQKSVKIKCSEIRSLEQVAENYPQIAEKYFGMRFNDLYKESSISG